MQLLLMKGCTLLVSFTFEFLLNCVYSFMHKELEWFVTVTVMVLAY